MSTALEIRQASAREVRVRKYDLEEMADLLSGVAIRVKMKLEKGSMVNPLGELQALGYQFDVACAAYQCAVDHLETIDAILAEAK